MQSPSGAIVHCTATARCGKLSLNIENAEYDDDDDDDYEICYEIPRQFIDKAKL